MSDPDPLLDFGVNLDSVVDRLKALKYFVDVSDIEAATVAIEEVRGLPPAAFVSVASETAERNKLIGGHAQRVTVSVSTLFCIKAASRLGDRRHATDRVKRAVMRQLVNFKPEGALDALQYDRFLMRGIIDGLIWGEVLTRTSYRFEA